MCPEGDGSFWHERMKKLPDMCRLARKFFFASFIGSALVPPAHADICKPSDVKNLLDQLVVQPAYQNCGRKLIVENYSESLGNLVDAVTLLEGFYVQVVPEYTGGTQTVADDSDYTRDISSIRNTLEKIKEVDWQSETVVSDVTTKVQSAYTHAQRMMNGVESIAPSEVKNEYRIIFCTAVLEWRKSFRWRNRYLECSGITE